MKELNSIPKGISPVFYLIVFFVIFFLNVGYGYAELKNQTIKSDERLGLSIEKSSKQKVVLGELSVLRKHCPNAHKLIEKAYELHNIEVVVKPMASFSRIHHAYSHRLIDGLFLSAEEMLNLYQSFSVSTLPIATIQAKLYFHKNSENISLNPDDIAVPHGMKIGHILVSDLTSKLVMTQDIRQSMMMLNRGRVTSALGFDFVVKPMQQAGLMLNVREESLKIRNVNLIHFLLDSKKDIQSKMATTLDQLMNDPEYFPFCDFDAPALANL